MATPTIDPAVPGAFGANPAPPAVATTIAIQSVARNGSLFVFRMSIGSVNFLWRAFVGRNAKLPARPFAEIDQFATLAAERAVRIAGLFDFFFASWAFHGRSFRLTHDPANNVVLEAVRDLDVIETARDRFDLAGIIDQHVTINVRCLHLRTSLQ